MGQYFSSTLGLGLEAKPLFFRFYWKGTQIESGNQILMLDGRK